MYDWKENACCDENMFYSDLPKAVFALSLAATNLQSSVSKTLVQLRYTCLKTQNILRNQLIFSSFLSRNSQSSSTKNELPSDYQFLRESSTYSSRPWHVWAHTHSQKSFWSFNAWAMRHGGRFTSSLLFNWEINDIWCWWYSHVGGYFNPALPLLFVLWNGLTCLVHKNTKKIMLETN